MFLGLSSFSKNIIILLRVSHSFEIIDHKMGSMPSATTFLVVDSGSIPPSVLLQVALKYARMAIISRRR